MKYLIPILGLNTPSINPALKERILNLILRMGYDHLAIDLQNIATVEEFSPLNINVPWTLVVSSTKPGELDYLHKEFALIISQLYPYQFTIKGVPESLPAKLLESANQLSLDRFYCFPQEIQIVLRIIHKELGNCNLSVEQISNTLKISRDTIERKFKKNTGVSIWQYILQKRIAEATRLLKTTEYTISQIAYAVGYDDLSSFDHYFKKTMSITPRALRQKNK